MADDVHDGQEEVGIRSKPRMVMRAFARKMRHVGLSLRGYEVPDPTPLEPPVGYVKQPPLHEVIRAMVRSEQMRYAAEVEGMDTFEEADDFDVPDDPYPPGTDYEVEREFEPQEPLIPDEPPADGAAAGGVSPKADPVPPPAPAKP